MKREVIYLFILFLLIPFASASFSVGSPSHLIDEQYPPGGTIIGWTNISLSNEPINSLFETNLGGSITLSDLIELNSVSYSCIPTNCENDYSTVGAGKVEKVFDIPGGKEALIGFKISGQRNFVSASDFSLTVKSNAGLSDFPQLYVDILNDGEIEWYPYKPAGNFKSRNYGCFGTPVESTALITQTLYCEKVTLPSAPNVTIGAGVSAGTGGTVVFEMTLDEVDGSYYSTCEATATESGNISCSPPDFRTTEEKDFFVCIKTKNSADDGNYSINYERNSANGICGFSGYYAGSYSIDFEIFARSDRFAAIGTFVLNSTELGRLGSYVNIENYISQYISSRYNNNCSLGCVIPIRFIAGENQNINSSNFKIKVQTDVVQEIKTLYDISESPAKVNSGFQRFYLDEADFSAPEDFGEATFTLKLSNSEIFSQEISVEKIPQIVSLSPKVVIAVIPTEFEVEIEDFDSEGNITEYKWNFGNGDAKATTENKISYGYSSLGKYNLTITITTSEQLSASKTFEISVETPKEAVSIVLGKKLFDLNSIKQQIASLPAFYQTSLESMLNLAAIEDKLKELQQENIRASSDGDYVSIMKGLISIELPEAVATTAKTDSVIFYPEDENIDLNALKEIGGGTYDAKNREKYANSILGWNQKNMKTEVSFERFSSVKGESIKTLLNVFTLKIEKKNATSEPYLIISKIDGLKFEEDYSEKENSEYFYIELKGSGATITFSTTEDVDFISLPAFISPKISELSLSSGIIENEESLRLVIFILVIILWAIIGFVAYVILQEWYKRRYENYLFKNKNDLYNLVTYIQSSNKRGVEEKEMLSGLKKAGWNPEQIKYVTKKYLGKRTGMIELPLGKIIGRFKREDNQKKKTINKSNYRANH